MVSACFIALFPSLLRILPLGSLLVINGGFCLYSIAFVVGGFCLGFIVSYYWRFLPVL
jgi:hypothetical protein